MHQSPSTILAMDPKPSKMNMNSMGPTLNDVPDDLLNPLGGGGDAMPAVDKELSKHFRMLKHKDQIKMNPDMYLGCNQMQTETVWIPTDGSTQDPIAMKTRTVTYAHALVKLVDEAIVNASDDAERTMQHRRTVAATTKKRGGRKKKASSPTDELAPVTKIVLTVDPDEGTITVWNDGNGIPVFMHADHNIHSIEMLFGHLNSSENYRKNKTTGGKNGYGIKLANIFSHELTVSTMDRRSNTHYEQHFEDHMDVIHPPVITKGASHEPFASVTFRPDLSFFEMRRFDDDLLAMLRRRAYDLSVCCGPDVSVVFNNEEIRCGSLSDYMQLYIGTETPFVCAQVNNRWQVGIALNDTFQQVSFVNGIHTSKGGRHVDYVVSKIYAKLWRALEKKHKVKVPESYMRQCMSVFVIARIEDPMFDGQTKDRLTTPARKFEADELASTGTVFDLSDDFLKQVFALGLPDAVMEYYQYKETSKADREGKKKIRLGGIVKLDDANWAGGSRSSECTLILTEGDSAKALAIASGTVLPSLASCPCLSVDVRPEPELFLSANKRRLATLYFFTFSAGDTS